MLIADSQPLAGLYHYMSWTTRMLSIVDFDKLTKFKGAQFLKITNYNLFLNICA